MIAVGLNMQEAVELLVKRAQKGDNKALEELLFAYEKKVYNTAYRYMGNEADAYDMAQEALIKIYSRIKAFKGDSSFSSWVYRLTVNTCLDGLRKTKKKVISLDASIEGGASYKDNANILPEEEALRVELRGDIQKAINTLSSEHKSVVILRDINGLSYEEVAQYLSVSVGTVKSRISRARQKLKESLIIY
jgi:RNA polymerase sigma-70 factor (ECF subfamily)